jgi:NadR type nicotinamide-nucleotide adenylyltransferase
VARRFTTGLVVGKFAPLHRGHQRLIDTARAACERLVVMVWAHPDFPDQPTPVRAGWLRTLYPDATVVAFDASEAPPDEAPAEVHHAFVEHHLPFPIEAVFTAEAYGPAFAHHLGAEHVALDRADDPVSGTAVRADVHAHRDALDPRVYSHFVEKVVFLGAESSGKTTLARELAAHFGTTWAEEYGRTLWEERDGDVPLADYVQIAERHLAIEEERLLGAHRYLFVDTNALTTQQYAFFFHGDCPTRVQQLAGRCRERYDHVFVCTPDFGLVQDGTRVHPQVQQYMDGAIRNDLTVRGIPYRVVRGSVAERIEQVSAALEEIAASRGAVSTC